MTGWLAVLNVRPRAGAAAVLGMMVALALGLPAHRAEAAMLCNLTVMGGQNCGIPVQVCYNGAPNSETLTSALPTPENTRLTFMNYSARVDARGLYANFGLLNYQTNSGSMTLRATDVFTVQPGAQTVAAGDRVAITARLRVTGGFGVDDIGNDGSAVARARGIMSTPFGTAQRVTTLDGTDRDVTTGSIDLVREQALVPWSPVSIVLAPSMLLEVEVGRAFAPETVMDIMLRFSGTGSFNIDGSDPATGGRCSPIPR